MLLALYDSTGSCVDLCFVAFRSRGFTSLQCRALADNDKTRIGFTPESRPVIKVPCLAVSIFQNSEKRLDE